MKPGVLGKPEPAPLWMMYPGALRKPSSRESNKVLIPDRVEHHPKAAALLLALCPSRSAQKAGALPCRDRAFMTEIEALGVSSERKAGSPSYSKE